MSSKEMKAKVAVLTGGGCAPGLDPFLEAFARKMNHEKYEVVGIEAGWRGLLRTPPNTIILEGDKIEGLTRSGSTSIGTSRTNPYQKDIEDGEATVLRNLKKLGVAGLVSFGGDDTLTVAYRISQAGANIIGVPKTMDLDLSGTDYSVGFWSYNEAVYDHAIPGFIDTLKSHQRCGVLELFGRHSGFTAVVAGIAGGACYIAIPEMELDLQQMADRITEFYSKHKWALVIVGEAVRIKASEEKEAGKKKDKTHDSFDNVFFFKKQTGSKIVKKIEELTGIESRYFQATHPFRGDPSAYDAFYGFRMGVKAAEMVVNNQWGRMVSVRGDQVTDTSLKNYKPRRIITPDTFWYDLVKQRNEGII